MRFSRRRLCRSSITRLAAIDIVLIYLLGFALALPTVGGGEALARAAHELPPPRVQALQRTASLVLLFALLVTALRTFLFVLLVPAREQALWANAPLAGLAQHLAGPAWARDLVGARAGRRRGAAAAFRRLTPRLSDAEQLLQRLSVDGTLSERLASLHTRFGTPARAIDVTAAAMILVMLVSGGRVTWLARAYAMAIAVTLVLKIAALVRLRRRAPGDEPFQAPLNLRVGRRELPLGLLGSGAARRLSARPR